MGEAGEDYIKREPITKERHNCDKLWQSSGSQHTVVALSIFQIPTKSQGPPWSTPSPGMGVALILPTQAWQLSLASASKDFEQPFTLTSSLYSRKLYVFYSHVLLG